MPGILLIAATTGYQTKSFGAAAAALGVEVTFATDRCHVLEDPWRDKAVAVRFEEPEESAQTLARVAKKLGIEAVAAVGDRPALVAALTARELDIAWHPPKAARRCLDKSLMRLQFAAEGLAVPAHALITGGTYEPAPGIGYPCVLKPLRLSASRGVIRANNAGEFTAALKRVRKILADPAAPVQIEKYIPGREFALEGLVNEGDLTTLAIFDKPDPLTGPFFEETIYVTPSREPAATQRAIIETTARAVCALGLWHGPVHAEMRVNAKGVWMLEVAARPIGGLCSRTLRFDIPSLASRIGLEQLVVLHAMGRMPPDIEPARPASGVMMIPVPRKGILAGLSGVEAARAVPGIDDVVITAKAGEKLIPLPEGSSYTGFIFAGGSAPALVEEALRKAHAHLRFEMLSDLTVIA
ncbi:MAG: ATP-grasp domain-containing protein [Acidobacteriota bacterium]|nr:ATP-grasp domain-containing protein [Acidobacteriota bacterium]